MEIVIKNYGAIQEAKIDLSKKLYVFIGYNNTGKTYLTKLMYEIFNNKTLDDFSISNHNNFNYDGATKLKLTKKIIDSILGDYSTYLKEVVIKKSLKVDIDDSFLINFKYLLEDIRKSELKSGATIDAKQINAEVEIYNLSKAKNSMDITFEHRDFDYIFSKLPSAFFDNIPKKIVKEQVRSIKSNIAKNIVNLLLNLLLQNSEKSFFLPSNRVCILENAEEFKRKEENRKKELSELLIDILENQKEQPTIHDILAKKSESEYPSYTNHLINKILALRASKEEDFLAKGTGFYDALLLRLYDILEGKIVFEKPTSISTYVEKFEMKNGRRIRIDLASSSVNQLSILFLFLKYWAKSERNFLMIDEPEENLHPENQILLFNLLLEFASNNRLLITTHSPLVTEVINNYLMISQLDNKDALAKEFGLTNIGITPSDTGIYYFHDGIITEHKIEQYGTTFTSFKIAQDKVYSLGEKLSDLMFNQINRK